MTIIQALRKSQERASLPTGELQDLLSFLGSHVQEFTELRGTLEASILHLREELRRRPDVETPKPCISRLSLLLEA